GLVELASRTSTPEAAPSADNGASATDTANKAALAQFYAEVFARIAPNGSDVVTQVDIDNGFDQLELPASLRAFTSVNLYARLDPYLIGHVSRDNFIRDMTDLVAAAKDQDAQAT